MDPKGQALLNLMFNPGEQVCVSPNKFGFQSIPLEHAMDGRIELVPPDNKDPLSICQSSDLTMIALNPINGFRRDENVTAFRSFLIEMDVGTIKEQLGTIEHLKMPFSAQVFSGNKSVHTIIVLDEDLKDEKFYRIVAEWILRIVSMADRLCKNPSRSVRIPGAYREFGKKQRLIKLNKRVSHKELFDWLNKYLHLRPKAREKRIVPVGQADFSLLSIWARVMLTKGIDFADRGRNQTFFGLAYDLALAGFTEDSATEILLERFVEENDFKEKELLRTIQSAFERVEKERA